MRIIHRTLLTCVFSLALVGMFLVCLPLSKLTVNADLGDTLLSFNARADNSIGLVWANGYLWNIGHGYDNPARLLKLDPSNGEVLENITVTGVPHGMGLTWDGEYFWVVSHKDSMIYKIDMNGSAVLSFRSPCPNTWEAGDKGLAWDGTYLWYADADLLKIFQLDPADGSVIKSFASPAGEPQGLTWDGRYLWHFDNAADRVYKLEPSNGSTILSFPAPGDGEGDLAWDGNCLWLSRNWADTIYKIDVGNQRVHNLNSGLAYATIQEAINNASEGDTLFADSDLYHENVVVNRSVSLIGEDKYTTVIDGDHTGNVVYVTANAVNITGFTIRNSGQDSKAGVLIGRLWDIQSSGNNISDNIITSNYYGILLAESFNSTISNNIVTNNTLGVQDQSRDYDCDIWTMNADGSNQTLLTTDELWDDGPEWYPNDSRILFERVPNPFVNSQAWDIWAMNTDGTNQTQLTTDSKVNMLGGWSPNCSFIVYNSQRSGNDDIWIMNSDGTNHRQLTTDPAADSMPTWSPDSTKISFISDRTGNQDMWIMNADGTNQTQLTIGMPLVMGGSWSPDSSKIVFHSIEGGWNGNWDIWTINSDGTNPTKLFSSPYREAFPHWSPDGTKIAYGSDEAGSWDIWIMNPDGTNRSRITTQWDAEEICSWSPDGSKLAFARAEWSLSCYNKITDNTIAENQQEGIRLQQAIGVTVEGNLIYCNGHGLVLYQTHGNTIADNTVTNNTQGIAPGGVAGFGVGIYLNMGGSNTLRNNSMSDNRFNFCIDAHSIEEYSNDIDESNTANGKRIYYWLNQEDRQVPSDAACVLLINSTNILVENLNVSNHCGFGVLLWSTTNSTVRNVISSNNANGIGLTLSSGNVVENNTVTDILPQLGIWLQDASYNTLRNNIMLGNVMSFGVVSNGPSVSIQAWMNDIDNSNRIDGKPIYYWVDQHNLAVPNDAAVAYLVNCSGITIRDLSVSNTLLGITLVNTNNSVIDNVTTHYCVDGVTMVFSNNNSISNSLITDGVWWSSGGVLIGCDNNTIMNSVFSNMLAFQAPSGGPPSGFGLFVIGNNNKVFHNSFMNNTAHIGTMQSSQGNVWDDSYPSGGNYYSNYTGTNAFCGSYQNVSGSDGIGDTPYIIDPGNQDHYPLIKPYGIQHDIGITSVTTAKTVVGQGYSLNVSVRIVNYGISTETFNITLHANTTTIHQQAVTLANRDSTTITLTWNTTNLAKGNYTISASAEPVLGETDTTDNALSDGWVFVSMIGDINADGKVDVKDVYAVGKAFGTSLEGPNPPGRTYNPNCDINGDDKVDVKDYYIVCKNYGRVDP